MPKVPERELSRVGQPVAVEGTRRSISTEEFGSGTARALQQTGDLAFERGIEMQQRINETRANEALQQADSKAREILYGYNNPTTGQRTRGIKELKGKEGIDVYKNGEEAFRRLREDAMNGLDSEAQRRAFSAKWDNQQSSYLDTIARHQAEQNIVYRKSVKDATRVLVEEHAGQAASQIENDRKNWRDYTSNVTKQLDGVASQYDPKELADMGKKVNDVLKGAVVRGWYKDQPDPAKATNDLYKGETGEPEVDRILGSMTQEARDKMFEEAVSQRSKIMTMENARRSQIKEEQEARDNEDTKDFYLNPDLQPHERQAILDRVTESPYTSFEEIAAMEEFQRNGGKDLTQTNQNDFLVAEYEIRNGNITNELDLVRKYRGKISIEDMRSQLSPLIQAQQDKRFSRASRFIRAKMGVPDGTAFDVLGTGAKEVARRLGNAEAELLEWYEDNPSGDIMAQAKIIAEREAAGPSANDGVISILENTYLKAVNEGKPDDIAEARDALTQIYLLNNIGDASLFNSPTFDLRKYIEEERTK